MSLQGDRRWQKSFKTHKLALFVVTTQILAWLSFHFVETSQPEVTAVLSDQLPPDKPGGSHKLTKECDISLLGTASGKAISNLID